MMNNSVKRFAKPLGLFCILLAVLMWSWLAGMFLRGASQTGYFRTDTLGILLWVAWGAYFALLGIHYWFFGSSAESWGDLIWLRKNRAMKQIIEITRAIAGIVWIIVTYQWIAAG